MFERISINDKNVLKKTCSILEAGGIIAYPTDTIYGLGCDACNDGAIQKINSIKQREAPMSVLCPDLETGSLWMNLPDHEKTNAKDRMMTATTIIVPVKDHIASRLVMGDGNTLGIRIPDHTFCIDLAKNYPNPITTTSVNRSGHNPHTDPDIIEIEFSNEIDLCIDDGIIKGRGSTIYKFNNGDWQVLR